MMKVRCECGQGIQARPEYAGRRVKCPACGQPIRLSDAAASESADSHSTAPESSPAAERLSQAGSSAGRRRKQKHRSGGQQAAKPNATVSSRRSADQTRGDVTEKQTQQWLASPDGQADEFELIVGSWDEDTFGDGSYDSNRCTDSGLNDHTAADFDAYRTAKLPARRRKKSSRGASVRVKHAAATEVEEEAETDEHDVSLQTLVSLIATAALILLLLAIIFMNALVDSRGAELTYRPQSLQSVFDNRIPVALPPTDMMAGSADQVAPATDHFEHTQSFRTPTFANLR